MQFSEHTFVFYFIVFLPNVITYKARIKGSDNILSSGDLTGCFTTLTAKDNLSRLHKSGTLTGQKFLYNIINKICIMYNLAMPCINPTKCNKTLHKWHKYINFL